MARFKQNTITISSVVYLFWTAYNFSWKPFSGVYTCFQLKFDEALLKIIKIIKIKNGKKYK